MSEVDDRFVKHGFWINWSQGPVMGRTITTSARTGTVVIAILTVLVTAAASQLWNLITFLYHQKRAGRATTVPSDTLFWQQQALLRTLPSPVSLAIDIFKLWLVWRKKSNGILLRCLGWGAFALLYGAAAVAAGIFSSLVVSTSNLEVMVQSPHCSQLNISNLVDISFLQESMYGAESAALDSYTRQCYQNTTPNSALCQNTYTNPAVKFDTIPADCPWNNSICLSEAIAMDTGILDTNDAFGLNLKPRDRVSFRRKTTCSVLPLEGYVFTKNASEYQELYSRKTYPGEPITVVRYGNVPDEIHPSDTFIVAERSSSSSGSYGYGVIAYSTRPEELEPDFFSGIIFTPIKEMNRTDADVAINLIVLQRMEYTNPVEDPLFAAHNQSTHVNYRNATTYASDYPVGLLGCAIQNQFCFSRPEKVNFCTPLAGLPSLSSLKNLEDASPIQLAVLQHLRKLFLLHDVTNGALSGFFTLSVSNDIGVGLPDNQWIKEAEGWESYAYSGMQTTQAEIMTDMKAHDPHADVYTYPPTNTGEEQLCQSLRMKKGGDFANINVFGLAFVVAFSITIIVFNTASLKVFIFLSHFRLKLSPRIDCWIQDGVFQLQRRAFDAYGQGTWEGLSNEIPSTKRGQQLTILPVSSSQSLSIPKSNTTTASTSNASQARVMNGSRMPTPPQSTPPGHSTMPKRAEPSPQIVSGRNFHSASTSSQQQTCLVHVTDASQGQNACTSSQQPASQLQSTATSYARSKSL